MSNGEGLDQKKEFYPAINEINNVAESGVSTLCSMGSQKKTPFSFDDLHFVPVQVFKIPSTRVRR